MNTNTNFYNVLFNNKKIIKTNTKSKTQELSQISNKRVLILINATEDASANKLIDDIMKACNVPYNQYEINTEVKSWKEYKNDQFQEILQFGDHEKNLDLSIIFPKNRATKFDDRIWIKTDDIYTLTQNKNLKNDLWNMALKPYFLPA